MLMEKLSWYRTQLLSSCWEKNLNINIIQNKTHEICKTCNQETIPNQVMLYVYKC